MEDILIILLKHDWADQFPGCDWPGQSGSLFVMLMMTERCMAYYAPNIHYYVDYKYVDYHVYCPSNYADKKQINSISKSQELCFSYSISYILIISIIKIC